MAGLWARSSTTAKIVTGVVAVAVAGSAVGVAVTQVGGSEDRDRATVVRVIDGDTIDAEVNGDVERVRLLNVDTPETKHPEKSVQCLGPEATDFLEGLLEPGDRIELVYDVERTDRYDRTLAGVFKEDSLVNAGIAAAGLGVAVLYEPNDRFYQDVLDAQEQAEAAGEGLHDPQVECTLPALAEALPPLEELPAEMPADAAGVAAAVAAAIPVIAAGEALGSALDLVESGSHVVLAKAYSASVPEWRKRHDAALPLALAYQQDLTDRGAALQKAAEEKAAAEKAAAERKAEEERQAEEARKEAARQAEAERKAEVEAERKAEAERQAQEERNRQRQQAPAPTQRAPAPIPQAPRPQQPSSGYGTDADFPGYTGPRCYAPGGQSWRPC